MLTIINNNTDPSFNLAVEEYVLKYLNITEDFLLIWQNKKCVVIGRNQSPFNDLNGSFINKNHIPVVRRATNEKAIYYDDGCINFAFVVSTSKAKIGDFKYFLDPVVKVLNRIGINAHIKNKQHLYVDKDQISLDFQNVFKDKIIHHGIIYLDSNLSYMKLINKYDRKISIVNAKKHFKQPMTVSMFRLLLLNELLGGKVSNKVYKLNSIDFKRINQLVTKKYGNWDWNYGESKEFLVKKEFEKRMLVTLIVKRGFIRDVTVDSFEENNVKIEKALLNVRFDEVSLKKAISSLDDIDSEKFIDEIMY